MVTKNKIKKEKYFPKGIVFKLIDLVDECFYFQTKEKKN